MMNDSFHVHPNSVTILVVLYNYPQYWLPYPKINIGHPNSLGTAPMLYSYVAEM